MLFQIQEQEREQKQKQKISLSQILKNANESQCFGHFMKISEIKDLGEHHQIKTTKTVHEVCVNGLLMLKAGIVDESSTFSLSDIISRRKLL
jgi:hypothetical protein